jgi:hypothetical protein
MSPKLFREITNQHGFVIFMFPNDHLPAHVHVYHGEKVTRINFEPVELEVLDSTGFRERELKKICQLLKPHREQLIETWNKMHPETPYQVTEDTNDE